MELGRIAQGTRLQTKSYLDRLVVFCRTALAEQKTGDICIHLLEQVTGLHDE